MTNDEKCEQVRVFPDGAAECHACGAMAPSLKELECRLPPRHDAPIEQRVVE